MYDVIAINKKATSEKMNNNYIVVNKQLVHNSKMRTRCNDIVAVVCEGVFEHNDSVEATKIAAEVIKEYGICDIEADKKRIEEQVFKKKLKFPYSTIVGVVSNNDGLLLFNAGNSKSFMIKNNNIEQLSIDDLQYEEVSEYTTIELLTNFLGSVQSHIHQKQIDQLEEGESILICSKYFSYYINHYNIKNLLRNNNMSINEKAKELIELFETAEFMDNASLILIENTK